MDDEIDRYDELMGIGKLLIDDRPILILPELVRKIGLIDAVVLQQVHYWLKTYKSARKTNHFRDGRWWVYNSIEQWQEDNFPWWSVPTVKRSFKNLRDRGLLLTANYNKLKQDRTLWYSIDYEKVAELLNEK